MDDLDKREGGIASKENKNGIDSGKAAENAGCDEVVYLPVNEILLNPFMVKQHYSARTLENLKFSMLRGEELHPIYVRKLKSDMYELLSGEKWLIAAKIAGLEAVPAIIFNLEDGESALKHLLRRSDDAELHFFEEAEAYRMLLENDNYKQRDLAGLLGKSQSAVANKLRLLRFSPQVRRQIVESGISERHARAILQLTDERLQQLAVKRVKDNRLSVKQAERLVHELQNDRELLGRFLAESRQKASIPGASRRGDTVFLNGNNVRNLKQVINILKDLVIRAGEYGLSLQAGQRSTETAVEFVIKVPKRENGINIRRADKNIGIIEAVPLRAVPGECADGESDAEPVKEAA